MVTYLANQKIDYAATSRGKAFLISTQDDATITSTGCRDDYFNFAPVRIASALSVVCAAFSPKRKSLSLNVA